MCHHVRGVDQCLSQVDDLRTQQLSAGEGQELSGQTRSSIGSLYNEIDSTRPGARWRLLLQQRGIATDNRQEVVELMSDAACEPANRLQFLRVIKRVLR